MYPIEINMLFSPCDSIYFSLLFQFMEKYTGTLQKQV